MDCVDPVGEVMGELLNCFESTEESEDSLRISGRECDIIRAKKKSFV